MLYVFIGNCVSLPAALTTAMTDHPSSKRVNYRTMLRNCPGLKDLAKSLNYDRDLPLSKDWHVSFNRSVYDGKRCYYMVWSAFEYVFTPAQISGRY